MTLQRLGKSEVLVCGTSLTRESPACSVDCTGSVELYRIELSVVWLEDDCGGIWEVLLLLLSFFVDVISTREDLSLVAGSSSDSGTVKIGDICEFTGAFTEI